MKNIKNYVVVVFGVAVFIAVVVVTNSIMISAEDVVNVVGKVR